MIHIIFLTFYYLINKEKQEGDKTTGFYLIKIARSSGACKHRCKDVRQIAVSRQENSIIVNVLLNRRSEGRERKIFRIGSYYDLYNLNIYHYTCHMCKNSILVMNLKTINGCRSDYRILKIITSKGYENELILMEQYV